MMEIKRGYAIQDNADDPKKLQPLDPLDTLTDLKSRAQLSETFRQRFLCLFGLFVKCYLHRGVALSTCCGSRSEQSCLLMKMVILSLNYLLIPKVVVIVSSVINPCYLPDPYLFYLTNRKNIYLAIELQSLDLVLTTQLSIPYTFVHQVFSRVILLMWMPCGGGVARMSADLSPISLSSLLSPSQATILPCT